LFICKRLTKKESTFNIEDEKSVVDNYSEFDSLFTFYEENSDKSEENEFEEYVDEERVVEEERNKKISKKKEILARKKRKFKKLNDLRRKKNLIVEENNWSLITKLIATLLGNNFHLTLSDLQPYIHILTNKITKKSFINDNESEADNTVKINYSSPFSYLSFFSPSYYVNIKKIINREPEIFDDEIEDNDFSFESFEKEKQRKLGKEKEGKLRIIKDLLPLIMNINKNNNNIHSTYPKNDDYSIQMKMSVDISQCAFWYVFVKCGLNKDIIPSLYRNVCICLRFVLYDFI
jgi:hypothetical protein